MRKSFALLAAVLCLSLSACSYYRVTDSDTGDVYYTNDILKAKKSETKEVTFTEKISREKVTLTSAGVEKISRSVYKGEVQAIKQAASL